MSKGEKQSQASSALWVGIDWGEYRHAVSVVDADRRQVTHFTVKATLEGYAGLGRRLREVGSISGIAIEATANLVVQYLLSEGYRVYLVNPKLSKNWRDSNSVAGVKSDARDGHVLAVELSRRHESLRAVCPSDATVSELASLCETVRSLVHDQTALMQELKSVLRQYYPAALDFFNDWSSPVAWRFLKKFPCPEKLARTRKETLCGFLKANRVGLRPRWLERIDAAHKANQWPTPMAKDALELRMLSIVARLQALKPHIEKCDALIAKRVEKLPQAELIRTLPGAGDRLAPALTAIAALVSEEKDPLTAMRCLSGVAPIENSSGKRQRAMIRRRCNKHWRNVFHLFARMSVQSCGWAHAFYELCRERGDGYATALRKLADKWLKIIHKMLKDNEKYDDARYVEALKKAGSPVYQRLCGESCG